MLDCQRFTENKLLANIEVKNLISEKEAKS